ncbi:MAG: hypothetical protein QE263_02015 [Vampirovibrionales bacterium]|nr:hypothetical protein [Vampirovibrionales bacterium]
MSLEKDPADKEVVPQLLDDSLASTIVKITFWPIVFFNIIAGPIEYPWVLGFTYDALYFLKPWSTPTIFITSLFTFYSLARLVYLKRRNIEHFKITIDIAIVSVLVLLALIANTYDFVHKNW